MFRYLSIVIEGSTLEGVEFWVGPFADDSQRSNWRAGLWDELDSLNEELKLDHRNSTDRIGATVRNENELDDQASNPLLKAGWSLADSRRYLKKEYKRRRPAATETVA